MLEGTRCNDPEAGHVVRRLNLAAETMIRDYVAARHPEEAERLTDFVSTIVKTLVTPTGIEPVFQP